MTTQEYRSLRDAAAEKHGEKRKTECISVYVVKTDFKAGFDAAYEHVQALEDEVSRLKQLHAELPASNPPPRFCKGCSDCMSAHSVIYALRNEVKEMQEKLKIAEEALKECQDHAGVDKPGFGDRTNLSFAASCGLVHLICKAALAKINGPGGADASSK